MDKRLLELLCCPACACPELVLESTKAVAQKTIQGQLTCPNCQRNYPIQAGIPCFLLGQEAMAVKVAFSEQWELRSQQAFETEERVFWLENQRSVDYLNQKLFQTYAPGEWVLDGGCGSGEKSLLLAQSQPQIEVIAFDFSDSLPRLAAKAKGQKNLHLIQGDVSHPPFRPQSLDKIVSIGVLHHTPHTLTAFQALAACLKFGGKMVVWLYPHPQESPAFQKFYYVFRDRFFGGKGHLMSAQRRLTWLKVLCLPLFAFFPLFWLSRSIRPALYDKLSFKDIYRGLIFLLYDDLAPAYQHRHHRLEVMNWYYEAGFTPVANPELGLFYGEKLSPKF